MLLHDLFYLLVFRPFSAKIVESRRNPNYEIEESAAVTPSFVHVHHKTKNKKDFVSYDSFWNIFGWPTPLTTSWSHDHFASNHSVKKTDYGREKSWWTNCNLLTVDWWWGWGSGNKKTGVKWSKKKGSWLVFALPMPLIICITFVVVHRGNFFFIFYWYPRSLSLIDPFLFVIAFFRLNEQMLSRKRTP